MLRIYYRTVMDTCTVLLQLSRVELRCKLQEDRAFTGLLQLVNKLQQTCQCHACCNLSILSLLQLWRGGGEILMKHPVTGATVKRVGGPQCVITCLSCGPTLALASLGSYSLLQVVNRLVATCAFWAVH